MENNFKYTIIGAGIIGLAISEKLSQYDDNILVVEKEKKFGLHTSSRNSEVIHSGFYYPENSLKSILCVKGNQLMYDFCDRYNIPYKKCGKLIIANTKEDIQKLEDILLLSKKNGVEGAKIISKKESLEIEPNVQCEKSLWIPSTGIVDSHLVMSKLENLSVSRNVSILYNLELNNIEKEDNGYKINFFNDTSSITTEYVINCAGLWAHKIANQLVGNKYEVEYYKGDYFKTSDIKNLNCLIYPVPKPLSLGAHVVINLNGEVLFGPNIYKVNNISYENNDRYKKDFLEQANKLLSSNIKNIYIDYSGIRPKIKYDGNLNDFIIKEEKELKNFYNLIGIDSPGLTSSLAIADYLVDLIKLN